MNHFKFIFILLAGFLFFSCDELTPVEEEPLEEVKDPDCLSMTGERIEKYYLEIDATFMEHEITLTSPYVLGYEYDNEVDPVSYGFNQITIHDVPLEDFVENSSFEAEVTGTVAVSANSKGNHIAYSAPFDTEILVSPERDYSREPFSVLNSFSNTPGDLILPYTGIYSTSHQVENFMNFTVVIPEDLLLSLNSTETFTAPYGAEAVPTEFTVDGVFPRDLVCKGDYYVLLTPRSRNFYQYENLTATFAPGAMISEIRANQSIVASHTYNPDTNSVTVTFIEYDYPYTGDVLFYHIQNEDGEVADKAIRIEG